MKLNLVLRKTIRPALIFGSAIAFLSACSSTGAHQDSASAPAAAAPATEAAANANSGPTDPEIAHIVVTANSIDVEAGELAKTRSKNKKVQDFAKRMITDHTGVNKQAVELATRLGVTPKDNAVSQSLKDGASKNIANLKGLSGKAFDKAYVDQEVAYHEAVLGALDNTLVPNVDNADLKALMVKVRPAFVAHLEHSKKLQATLSK